MQCRSNYSHLNKRIFDNLNKKNKEKIQKHKEKIIEYIKENKLNGMKLSEMKRKEFINLFTAYLGDKKLTAAMGAIYKDLMAYKQPNANENNVIISSKSKFITEEKIENNDEDDEKKKEYYSFGEKYLYNPKLSNSPLFVQPRYASIKDELLQYYARVNEEDSSEEVLQEQTNTEIYIHQPRVDVFIEKCKVKMNTDSVKQMKAAKNKDNNDYGIKPNDPITFEHVFALILYSQCTKLCTAFRYVLFILFYIIHCFVFCLVSRIVV